MRRHEPGCTCRRCNARPSESTLAVGYKPIEHGGEGMPPWPVIQVTERIDRLIHDAQHADSGYKFASAIGHAGPAAELRAKRDRLLSEARELYQSNADAEWPHPDDCEWTAPERNAGVQS